MPGNIVSETWCRECFDSIYLAEGTRLDWLSLEIFLVVVLFVLQRHGCLFVSYRESCCFFHRRRRGRRRQHPQQSIDFNFVTKAGGASEQHSVVPNALITNQIIWRERETSSSSGSPDAYERLRKSDRPCYIL